MMKPSLHLTSLKTDGAASVWVKPKVTVQLLKTHGLLKDSLQPNKSLADLKTDGLSISMMKPSFYLTSLKTTGDLLESANVTETSFKQVAQHTCDAMVTLKPKVAIASHIQRHGIRVHS